VDRALVIRYDARGHGRSTVVPGEYALDYLGRDALAVLDAAGVERAVVAGISLGG
jgi:pimeloyl-ACP methyl ester carboxylesterase